MLITFETNAVHSRAVVKHLQRYLSSVLRLAENSNDSLDTFQYLSFYDRYK